jgi:hypothetical protein
LHPRKLFRDKWEVGCECEQALARQLTPKSRALSFNQSVGIALPVCPSLWLLARWNFHGLDARLPAHRSRRLLWGLCTTSAISAAFK